MFEFTFNGKSSREFGMTVEVRPDLVSSESRMGFVNIDGRNGSLSTHLGYKPIPLKMSVIVESQEQMTAVKGWLKGEGEFTRSDLPLLATTVFIKEAVSFRRLAHEIFRAEVSFTMTDPFWYKANEDFTLVHDIEGPQMASTVTNEGNYQSKPVLKIVKGGVQRVLVRLGEVEISYDFPYGESYVDIDFQKVKATYRGGIRDRQLTINTDRPSMPVGESKITRNDRMVTLYIKRKDRWI